MARVEDAADGRQLFGVAVDLEATNWLQNDDKRRTRAFVDRATRHIELSRRPACRWWQVQCRLELRALQRQLDTPAPRP